jgi:hypothetical protein
MLWNPGGHGGPLLKWPKSGSLTSMPPESESDGSDGAKTQKLFSDDLLPIFHFVLLCLFVAIPQ